VINLGDAISNAVAVRAESFSTNDFDPAGETHVYTADFAAVTHLLNNRIPLDTVANIDLNDDASELQLYTGL